MTGLAKSRENSAFRRSTTGDRGRNAPLELHVHGWNATCSPLGLIQGQESLMMNRLIIGVAVLAIFSPFPLRGQGKTNPTLDKVTSELVAAFNAEDPAGAARLYAEDAILMPANMPMVSGRTAIENHFKKEFAATDMTLQLKPIESTIDGSHGFGIGTSTFTPKRGAPQAATGAGTVETGKYVLVFKRVGTEWKIAYDIFNGDMSR
jgi:ketosteroid isomerase-like protein